ncbi:MAG: hypothetical protein MUC69_04945 [Gemmatimonadales bacterium]|jgi:hypothetical protein|nr:hypothetical protein [Gemmatimonadales bacterium]
MRTASLPLLLLLGACARDGRPAANPACGIAALAAPTAVLEAFGVPQQTLSQPPLRVAARLPVRVAAGPVLPAIVGQSDSGLVVGVEGAVPASIRPAYGVMVVERGTGGRGVLLYEGVPVEGAPRIGVVSVGGATLPLLGVEVEMARIEDPKCPIFPEPAPQ